MDATRSVIRVLAFMEAQRVTGPAKNLIRFARQASRPEAGLPPVRIAIATFRRGSRSMPFVDAARSAGIPVHVIPERCRFDPAVLSRLRAVVREVQPDVVQTHNVKSHALLRLSGAWPDGPWIAFHHGYTATDWKDRLYNRLDRWSLRKADRVVVVCEAFASKFQAYGIPRRRIVVRHNSVPAFVNPAPEAVALARSAIGAAPGTLVVLAVGRLSREKGHADLLEAVALLRLSPLPPFRVVILGEGPERPALLKQCAARNLQDLVVFAGHHPDAAPFYAAADVLALPSHAEGSPNVVLEAMAAGVPVVATAVGGVPEIVKHGVNGWTVPPRQPEAMAAALARLLQEDELRRRLSAAGRRHAASSFSPPAYWRALAALYAEVLGTAGAHPLRAVRAP